MQRHWLASLGLGFGLLVGVPVLAVLVLAVGLLIGGWWIGLILLAAYFLVGVLGYLVFAEWAGMAAARLGKWQGHPVWSLLAGLAIVGMLTLIPFVGPLVGLVATVVGIGALTATAWSAYRGTRAAVVPPISTPTPTPLPAAA